MNLGVFNRVNLKDSTSGGMYSEWASLTNVIQNKSDEYSSVLNKLPIGSGRDVTLAVVKQLASNLGISQPAEPSPLGTDKEVQWCMEVLCHGLSLPLSEHDTIRDCVNVYCEWLSALHPTPKICVPKPICDDPNVYARKIISHFHNLFVPRKGEASDTINRQAVLCHRVLRTLQQLAQVSSSLDRETWEALLQFLLAINDTLLSPPTIKDDVGDQLCERVLSVLVEVWLVACVRCFPTPPLWKTLRELAMTWRHRLALIEQWNRVNLTLTSKLLEFMYGPTFPELKISDEDAQVMPSGMSPDCIAQCWFRFLHTLGSPVDLSRPQVISQTPAFLQHALTNDLADPSLHPCLVTLPLNFCKAIKGMASIVDAFLGLPVSTFSYLFSPDESLLKSSGSSTQPSSVTSTHSPTPPQRRLAKSFSISTTSSISKGTPKTSLIGLTSSRVSTVGHSSIPPNSGPPSTSSISSDPPSLLESTFPNLLHVVFWTQYGTIASLATDHKGPLAEDRPKCNSILHLFGEWLFEAALIGSDFSKDKANSKDSKRRPSSIMIDTVSVSSAGSMKGSLSMSQPGSLTDEGDSLTPPLLSPERYQVGRAEALGALCRIFGAKKTGEEILPIYLARFYICLQQGLRVSETRECEETLSSILLNSTDLFRLDLDGIQLLLPYFLDALELVLTEKDPKIKSQSVSKSELRRASTQILLSLLVLPLHYQNLPIKDLNSSCSVSHHGHPMTFESLKPRLVNLLITALQVENDLINTQALLGGLLLCVQDSALFEMSSEVSPSSDPPHVPGPESSHIQSSDAASAYSLPHSHHSIDSSSSFDSSNAFHSYDMDWSLPATVIKNSAHALFVRATYLVCHRLISSWKTDLNVSLAALELLSGLARTQIREADSVECKRAVKWLCDYITYQCWRPPQAHSKDLHSTIVAAFQCAVDWLVGHPYLLRDKDCLATVMEVVELGISGTKSQGKPGEPPKMKDEKELKPASLRVRDAAEALLTLVLEQVGYFPSVCGPESLSCLLDEVSLVKLCNSWPGGEITLEKAVPKFRYFVLENATLLALLEEPLGNDQDPQPSVTLLIRNSFGRLAWTLQLRHLPRHRSHHKHHQSNPGRPLPLDDAPARSLPRPKYFPDSVERIPQHQIDKCIPTLDSLILDDPNHDELSKLIDNQIKTETKIRTQDSGSKGSRSGKSEECTPPPACQEFQTARLFLSHFGFLYKLTDKQNPNSTVGPPQLLALDTSHPEFCADLKSLDNIGTRTCDTCYIFYVRNGQKQADEILANVLSDSAVSSSFLDMLYSLGWPVAVSSHPGWTGRHTHSKGQTDSSRSQMDVNELEDTPHGGSLFNGQSHVLYWADVSSEIAFVVPTPDNKHNNPGCDTWKRQSTVLEKPTRSVSVDHQTQPPQQQELKKKTLPPSTTVMIVWLESFQDSISFPISDLLPYCSTGAECFSTQPRDVCVIFLHALQSELLRVKLQGPPGRLSLATPLVEGMIISRRVVGDLVRQTALNMCRRRRLDSDSYQPPHVKRKLKIQEIVSKYQMQMSQPELLTFLLSNNESIFKKTPQSTTAS